MSSSQRLSKMSQYLTDGNYQQAVNLYDKRIQIPQTQTQYLLLAKAYFIAEHYQTTLALLKQIQQSRNVPLQFQAKMLQIKALYLHSSLTSDVLHKLEQFMQIHQNSFNYYHFHCLQQIKFIAQKHLATKNSKFASRQILYDQKNQFMQVYKKYDNFSPIMEGMPVYLISKRWFDQWQQFVSFESKVTGQNPGPITNFEIIDHIYQGYYDQRKHKSYTNNYLFEPCKYRIIPKQCWEFLHKRYGGIEIVRYNISDISKPNEIMTEVYLKKIALVQKSKLDFLRPPNTLNDIITYVQITRKQNWKGLIQNKLQKSWGHNGIILELVGNQTKKIDLNHFLEDCDTTGKVYVFCKQSNDINLQKTSSQKCGNIKCIQARNLRFCQCKSIKYCSMECLKQDRDRHRKKCELQMQHIKQNSAIISNFNLSEKQYSGRKGLVGLRNLGNTCYMNSGLQCLSNTKEITDYFMSNGFLKDINTSNPLGTKGNLACAYAELMRQIWAGRDDVVSPFNLKKMIGKFATQFSGYGQQDSQQFISYLIDGLQEDLNLVKKKQTFETKDDIVPDQEASLESQRNYAKRIQSYIRDLMAGQFKSTVRCLKCKKVSVCFDPYLLLSLPIPSPKMFDFYLVDNDLTHGAIKLYFQISQSATFKKLDNELRKQYKNIRQIVYLKFDKETFEIVEIIQNLNDKITAHQKESLFIFGYQIPEQDGQNDIWFTQFFYEKSRCGFPRFLKFPKKNWQNSYQKVVQESLFRASQKPYEVNIENLRKLSPPSLYDKICDKYLIISCKRELKLLTFKQNRDFQFTKQEGKGITLYDCLANFSKTEILQKQNEWYCGKCKTFVSAQKQLQIYKSNKILVLAFKRFSRMKKIKAFVDYPIQGFDIGPYLKCNKDKKPILYDLYGVVNHYGSLGGGHYTAFCQNFINKKWYQFNDSRVSEISRRQIVSDSSYVLFFRRRQ